MDSRVETMTNNLRKSGPKGVELPNSDQKPENNQRDEGMDKTLADSFPASDPPSSIPDPEDDENAA
jgi:hypothetical protein